MKNYIRIFSVFLFLTNWNLQVFSQNKNTEKIECTISLAKKNYDKGIDFGRNGILDSAFYYTSKAIKQLEKIQPTDSIFLANSYQSLGIINKLFGKYNEAIACYSEAEHIYIEKKNSVLAFVYGNKANIFYIQQDYSRAEDFQKQAIRILELDSVRYRNQLGNFYNNLANVYKKKHEYNKAIQFYKKNIKDKSKSDSYVSFGNLAICYQNLNNPEKAEHYFQLATETVREKYKNFNSKVAQQLMYYAIFLGNQQQPEKSKEMFDEALQIYEHNFGKKHPEISSCLNAIGEMYLENNNPDSALLYFQKSIVAIVPDFEDTNLESNPSINNTSSEIHLLRSLKNKAIALQIKASQNNSINEYKLSLEASEYATKLFTKIRKGYVSEESKLFLANNEFKNLSTAVETCYNLFNLTKDPLYIEKAFYYSESGKASVLIETIKNSKALNIGGIPDSLLNLEKELEKNIWSYEELIYEENNKTTPDKNKLEYWNRFLFNHKQEYSELLQFLETNFSNYHKFKHKDTPINLHKLQKNLSFNESIIEYFLTEDHLYTFLIKQRNIDFNSVEIDSSFYSLLNTFIQSVSNNDFSHHGYHEFNSFQTISFELYTILLKPFQNKTRNNNLIIIPDGILSYLPFESLTTQNKHFNKINYKHLPYLIFENAISYAHSVNFIETNRNSKVAIKNIGAFAPSYNTDSTLINNEIITRQRYREKLFPLKGVKDEVINITSLIEGDKYLDQDANESLFKDVANKYDILHLAMHTIIDDNNPMYSKMAFTQINDSINDGFLNTYELYNLKLNSRMAVLSSCNSGNGKMQRGEGVISLARGFIYSGCPSIVMTLWSVEDKSGVSLMTAFYENLIQGQSKAKALQQSKIDFIQNGDQLKSHPYFWSGYVVIGNNNALFKTKRLFIYLIIAGIVLIPGLVFAYRKYH